MVGWSVPARRWSVPVPGSLVASFGGVGVDQGDAVPVEDVVVSSFEFPLAGASVAELLVEVLLAEGSVSAGLRPLGVGAVDVCGFGVAGGGDVAAFLEEVAEHVHFVFVAGGGFHDGCWCWEAGCEVVSCALDGPVEDAW